MNCVEWYRQTTVLVREERWSEIKQAEYCNCWQCKEDLCLIEIMFVEEGKFCKKAQQAALYLNRNQKLNWIDAIIKSSPLSMEKLRCVVEEGLVDVNATSYYDSLASIVCEKMPYWRDALTYLFSNGCSPDIQDETGRSLLININSGWNGYNHQMTKFLLEHGADPLLEDKEGFSMVSYAEKYFSEEERIQFFELV